MNRDSQEKERIMTPTLFWIIGILLFSTGFFGGMLVMTNIVGEEPPENDGDENDTPIK